MGHPRFSLRLRDFAWHCLALAALSGFDFLLSRMFGGLPRWAWEINFPLIAFMVFQGIATAMIGHDLYSAILSAVGRSTTDGAIVVAITVMLFVWLIMPALIATSMGRLRASSALSS
jgi:hypothetical protein